MSDSESEGDDGFGFDEFSGSENEEDAGGFGDDADEDTGEAMDTFVSVVAEDPTPAPARPSKFAVALFKLIDTANQGKVAKIDLVDFCSSHNIRAQQMMTALDMHNKYDVSKEFFYEKFAAGELDFLKDCKVDVRRERQNSVVKRKKARAASQRVNGPLTLPKFLKQMLIPQFASTFTENGFKTVKDVAMSNLKTLGDMGLPHYVVDGIIGKAQEAINVTRTITRAGASSPLGMGVATEGKQVSVSKCTEGQPAWSAGMRVGDVILSINGIEVTFLQHAEVMSIIRGGGSRLSIVVTPHDA